MFAAADISCNGSLTASDAFTSGPPFYALISSAANYDSGALLTQLGPTDESNLWVFSDPDGLTSLASTRDILFINSTVAEIFQFSHQPPATQSPAIGWFLVSESAPIPEPSSTGLL